MFDNLIVEMFRKFFHFLDGGFGEFDSVSHLFFLRTL
jgi:hypothetical protein